LRSPVEDRRPSIDPQAALLSLTIIVSVRLRLVAEIIRHREYRGDYKSPCTEPYAQQVRTRFNQQMVDSMCGNLFTHHYAELAQSTLDLPLIPWIREVL
jgi:hypothetical protein